MKRRASLSRGMALIVVLWMVAALSVIAVGLLTTVRGEIQTASRQKQMVVAGALADAAIRRVLQDVTSQRVSVTHPIRIAAPLSGQPVVATVQPLNGLVDINNASEALLAALFQHAAGQTAADSEALAGSVVQTRSRRNAQGLPEGFDAPEDLMRVPGIDYSLYARISSLVSASIGGSGRVNPLAASPQLLTVLSQGNSSLAAQLASSRDSTPQAMDITLLNPAFIDTSPASALQVTARIRLDGQVSMVRTWFVVTGATPQTGLPWRVLDVRQHMETEGL